MKETLKVVVALLVVSCLQLYLTKFLQESYLLDLTLVAVIYFARHKTREQSCVIGGLAGLFQDAVSGLPLGMNGFSKTLVGYTASAVSGRLVTETVTMQFLLVLVMTLTDVSLKLALYRVFGAPLPGGSLSISFSQALVTATLGTVALAALRWADR